jgi:hypothetical protein
VAGILDKFYVEHGPYGAKVMARTPQLTGPTAEGEIDEIIQALKDDLDACAKEMKRVSQLNRASIFEGWSADA